MVLLHLKLGILFCFGVDASTGAVRRVRNRVAPTEVATYAAANYGDDESTDAPSALIKTWFSEHGLSKRVQQLRQANADIGDGVADPDAGQDGDAGAQWTYFLNSCMQQRQQVVAREVLHRKCQRVIEIGGYLTPLDSFLQKMHLNESATLPAEYLNIDPSVKTARITKAGGMRSVHVPMTIADFVFKSSEDFRNKFQLESAAKTCLVILSIWDPHVQTPADREALRTLLTNVSFAALESANDEMQHLKVVEKLASLTGLKREPNKSMTFDCREALKDEKSHWAGDEVENLRIMSHASSLLELSAPGHLAAAASSQSRGERLLGHVAFLSRLQRSSYSDRSPGDGARLER